MSVEQGFTEAPAHETAGQGAGQASGQDSDRGEFAGSDSHDADSSGGDSHSYELDENGQRVPHGMGQSKSSRRRRRKRKGKSDGGESSTPQAGAPEGSGATGGDVMPGEVIGSMQATAGNTMAEGQTNAPRQNAAPGRSMSAGQNQPAANGLNGAGTPGGTKRWKKKFRDRQGREGTGMQQNAGGFAQNGSQNGGGQNGGGQANGYSQNGGGFRGPDTHQPGNGGGFKRKGGFGGGKQRSGGGSRGGFVGPMDHSYRAPNGNIFESSPSTIDPYAGQGRGGGRGYQSDSQPIDYSQGRAIPIKEGTPTKIYFFIEDLFFTAKIQETARKLGVKIEFIKNEKEQIAALTSAEEDARPGLIVFDLNNANAKPLTLIPKLKTKLKKSTSIIGFLSHLQGDLKAKAVEAGCDSVMPRAAFSQNLPNLLRRYGIEEAEEPNYNQ